MHADDVLKYGHATVMSTIKGLSEEHWDTPGVCGAWSVREIMAHLTSFEHVLVDVLNSLLDSETSTAVLDDFCHDPLRFNDEEVSKRRGQSPAATLAEYKDTQAQTMALLQRIAPERRRQTGLLAWYGAEYDLEDFLVYSFYGHKREHCAQIAAFRDTLKRMAAERR